MACVTVADECFVMAAAGAQGPCPATVAIVFGPDVAALQKIGLLGFIDASGNVSQRVGIGVDKTVARRDISGGSHA